MQARLHTNLCFRTYDLVVVAKQKVELKVTPLDMEAASEKMKVTALEMEAASEKMKATALEMEAASEKMKATAHEMEAASGKTKATGIEMEAASEKMKATAHEMEAASGKTKATGIEMEAASEKIKATALEMEAASKKMQSSVLDIEAAPKKMAHIFTLTVNVILYIFRFLCIEDRIAFALSCQRFRQLCMDKGVFRKLDFSRCAISTTQRGAVNRFFRDRRVTQHIKELNINNLRFLNWQMDDHLEEFIMSICPQLEALHVVDCRVTLQTLQRILQEAPQLTALSWSIWDFTSEDKKFLSNTSKSAQGICFKNIKHLHLETLLSVPQIQIAKCLVLSSCRDLEELEICTWWILNASCTHCNFPPAADQPFPDIPEPSADNQLQNLHSLVVGTPPYAFGNKSHSMELCDLVVSVLSRKSSSTKWKKFCILPSTGISREHFSQLLREVHSDNFQSVDVIAANLGLSPDALDELNTLFQKTSHNTVRSLQLFLPNYSNSIVELCNPISRAGGHSLKFLSLSANNLVEIPAGQNVFIHGLFYNCLNITELDLLWYRFEKDICEPLSELKHLTKVQLSECAISSKYSKENQVEISKVNLLTFVENCKSITHLDIRGCKGHDRHFSCRLTHYDLLALAKLRNLEYLTLCGISGIREWTFLQNISEHCKFLTTLRISNKFRFNTFHFLSPLTFFMMSFWFLKHLAIEVSQLSLKSDGFWNLLSYAKNLERLCIRSSDKESQKIPLVAVEALRSLTRLNVLHLHSRNIENVDVLFDQMIRILEEKESDHRFSFEIVTWCRRDTWIKHPTRHTLISNKALPLNEAELCYMTPILRIPRF